MKNMKKILALLVAVLMIAGMVSAFAEAPNMDNYKQDVTFTNGDEGNTVFMVKLLSAVIGEDNVLAYTATADCPEAYNTEAKILAATDLTAMANAIGLVHADDTPGTLSAVFGSNGEATIEDVEPGWYFATVQGTENSGVIYKNMLVNTSPKPNADNGWDVALNNEVITASSKVTVKKETEEIYKGVGGEMPDHTVAVETSDGYSVGDTVPYVIETKIPNYPANSVYAKFNIVDAPSDLTDDVESVVVKVDGQVVNAGASTFSVTRRDDEDADGFKIVFVQSYVLANPGKAVVVEYNAVIKDTAVIATDGETAENTAHIEFNPNGYIDEDVKPDDTTKLYTYGVYVYKFDSETSDALAGAEFELTGNDNTYTGTTDENGYIDWDGLEAGTYTLTETKAPAGYKLRTPASITIVIDKDNPTVDGSEATFTNDPVTDATETNFLGVDVPNTPGTSLPSTGGMGTTILYVGGSILVILAAVLLITKRRMNAED